MLRICVIFLLVKFLNAILAAEALQWEETEATEKTFGKHLEMQHLFHFKNMSDETVTIEG